MIKKICVPQSVSVVVLCAAAAVTLWPLGRLKQEVNASIRRLEGRVAFVDTYRKQQKNAAYERFEVGDMDEPRVLSKLQETAQGAGLHLESMDVKPAQAGRDRRIQAAAFDLVVSGPEAGLLDFLGRIKTAGFLCRLVSLEVTAGARQEGVIRARMRIEKIDHAGIKVVFRKKEPIVAVSASRRRLFREDVKNASKNIGLLEKARPDRVKDLSLVGIVDDKGQKAAIEDKKTGKAVFLKEGDCLEGICVAEIGIGEVTLQQDGATFQLVL